MSVIPKITINSNFNPDGTTLHVLIENNVGLDATLFPVIYREVEKCIRFGDVYTHNKAFNCDSSIERLLCELVASKYLVKMPSRWKFFPVRYALDLIGLDIERYYKDKKNIIDVEFYSNLVAREDKDYVCMFLLNNNGKFIDDIKKMPVRLIEDLGHIFKRKEFDQAIGYLQNDMILDIANIKGDNINVVKI